MEEKNLSKSSKIILTIFFILSVLLVIFAIYFMVSTLNNNDKFVAVKEMYDKNFGDYQQRIEVEFKNKKMSFKPMMVFEDEEYAEDASEIFEYVDIDCKVDGNKLIITDVEKASVMLSGGLLDEDDVEEMFEKKYSKKEKKEALDTLKDILEDGGYTIK